MTERPDDLPPDGMTLLLGQYPEVPDDGSRHLVFVYGSLKEGFSNNRIMEQHGEYVGEAVTDDCRFTMISLGWFPGVCSGGDRSVVGEVYRVTPQGMAVLDRLESNGTFYTREETGVLLYVNSAREELDPMEGVTAWIYLLNPAIKPSDMMDAGPALRRSPYGVEDIDGEYHLWTWTSPADVFTTFTDAMR